MFCTHNEEMVILMQVPTATDGEAEYRLRIEGSGLPGAGMIFENETVLEFSRQFLSITISTNLAVYNGATDIRSRG